MSSDSAITVRTTKTSQKASEKYVRSNKKNVNNIVSPIDLDDPQRESIDNTSGSNNNNNNQDDNFVHKRSSTIPEYIESSFEPSGSNSTEYFDISPRTKKYIDLAINKQEMAAKERHNQLLSEIKLLMDNRNSTPQLPQLQNDADNVTTNKNKKVRYDLSNDDNCNNQSSSTQKTHNYNISAISEENRYGKEMSNTIDYNEIHG